MKAPTLQAKQEVIRNQMQALATVLPELTLGELRHLHEVLQRRSEAISREQADLVQSEIDGRKMTYLEPALVMS